MEYDEFKTLYYYGYEHFHTPEEVCKYFMDNKIIGEFVKKIELYVIGGPNNHGKYCFGDCSLEDRFHGHPKMSITADDPIILVCEFYGGNYLAIDCNNFDCYYGVYIRYAKNLLFPGDRADLIPSSEYNCMFDHLIGEKLEGISLPSTFQASENKYSYKDYDYFHLFESLYLDFTNHGDAYEHEGSEIYTDDVCFYWEHICLWCENTLDNVHPVIEYYTNRDIPTFAQNINHDLPE